MAAALEIQPQLPCGVDGRCMVCKVIPSPEESLTCGMCATPWHLPCLSSAAPTLDSALHWTCPDCSGEAVATRIGEGASGDGMLAAIRAIEEDKRLSEGEKARRRQEVLSGKAVTAEEKGKGKATETDDVLALLNGSFNCSFCLQSPQRPVTVSNFPSKKLGLGYLGG